MSGGLHPERFDTAARTALEDRGLRRALDHATGLFDARREAALADEPEWEAWREQARQIKEHTLRHLDFWLQRFEERLLAAGGRIHWARDADEACRIVSDIATASGARRAVKSKSMTTEEIGLNAHLEAAGVVPVETDLGEWIIQLAGETPSHIIVPAIHKSREQIGALFSEKLGTAATEDPEAMTHTARRILREHFAAAEMGISGVNFAIAETGSILILENEGNARMTTSLPRVHVAVMGIEKILPRLADLEVFLRLLPRSGTGQRLTSYQSLITGPAGPDGEGPRELHVVVLDGGRSALLGDELSRQALACIRCGACLNVCPVYRQVGGHAYGSVYPGPIGAVITPYLVGLQTAARLPFASSLCGACRDVCPVKIDIPALLLRLRARVVEGDARNRPAGHGLEARAFRTWAWMMTSPRRYRISSWFGRRGGRVLHGKSFLKRRLCRLLPPLAAWTRVRELRRPADRTFREIWKTELSDPRDRGGERS